MQYQGGKHAIAKPIAEIISAVGGVSFVSLFCGACSVESHISGFDHIICNDKHEYLIEMWQALQNGWDPPDRVSEEEYKYIQQHKDENKALTGFVGFGCSYGGKWFGGYAKNSNKRNYARVAKNGLFKKLETLRSAKFTCFDYRDVDIPNNCLIYADPPYDGTTKFIGMESFSSNEFWDYMRVISKDHIVFISELSAPSDFIPVWEATTRRSLDGANGNYLKAVEKLFVFRDSQVLTNKNLRDKGDIYGEENIL